MREADEEAERLREALALERRESHTRALKADENAAALTEQISAGRAALQREERRRLELERELRTAQQEAKRVPLLEAKLQARPHAGRAGPPRSGARGAPARL